MNQSGGQYTVYVMKNGVPTEQSVKVGLQDTLYAEILSGLQPGDVVAINYTVTK